MNSLYQWNTVSINACKHCKHSEQLQRNLFTDQLETTGIICKHPLLKLNGYIATFEAREPGNFCGPEAIHMEFKE